MNDLPAAVWPTPPDGLIYVRQSFPGNGDFISTGMFQAQDIGGGGQGRTLANVQRVTSLFFDADYVTVSQARRAAAGLPTGTAGEEKARLYLWPDGDVQDLQDWLLPMISGELSAALGVEPTAVMDSGWGLHFHYAVAGDAGVGSVGYGLRALHKSILDRVNAELQRLIMDAHGVSVPKMLDATSDVGARLCRIPGSVNSKAPGRPRACRILKKNLSALTLSSVSRALTAAQEDAHNASKAPKPSKAPSQPGKATHGGSVDFKTMSLGDGRTWQDVADLMARGEKVRVVCPFGGSSVGSGFFVKTETGDTRYYSGPTDTTFWNTARGARPAPTAAPVASSDGLAALIMVPCRNGGPDRPERSMSNLTILLTQDRELAFWFCSFSNTVMRGDRPLEDGDTLSVLLRMEAAYDWKWIGARAYIPDVIATVAKLDTRNLVTDLLQGLKWDGVERLDGWIDSVIHQPGVAAGVARPGADVQALYRVYARKWAISLVARALDPGCKVDTMLVLAGPQGFRKSTLFSKWAPDPVLHIDSPLEMRSTDRFLTIARALIYEDAELSSGTRSMEESKKAFLSSSSDTYRVPYGKQTMTVPRSCVIVGTTNEAAILKDATGSRRYWVVSCPKIDGEGVSSARQPKADLDWLEANRDQLLAEATAAYLAGEQWWLTPEEDECRARQGKEEHTFYTPMQESAQIVFTANAGGPGNAITCTEFMTAFDSTLTPAALNKIGMTIAGALKIAGFVKGGKHPVSRRTVYYKPLPPGISPIQEADATGLEMLRIQVVGGGGDVSHTPWGKY